MIRHFVYYLQVNRLGWKRMMFFSKDFILDQVLDIVGLVLGLVFYRILYFQIKSSLGIPLFDLYILVLTVKTVNDFYGLFFSSNISQLPQRVQYGTLDHLLIKPLHLHFQMFCSIMGFKALGRLLIDIVLFIIIVQQFQIHVDFLHITTYLLVLLLALLIFTSFHIILYLGAIIFIKFDAFTSLFTSFFTLSTFPGVIFAQPAIKWLFTYIIPVLIIGNFPLLALKQGMTRSVLLTACLCCAIFLTLAYSATRFMLRYYKSATS